jgi:hypothetical protein
MTIEEKAKDFASYNTPFLDDSPIIPVVATMMMAEKCDGFKAGAEWMLEKACEYMMNQYPVHYQEWAELADECVKQFKKAMEE